jgi:hypothetical protein
MEYINGKADELIRSYKDILQKFATKTLAKIC